MGPGTVWTAENLAPPGFDPRTYTLTLTTSSCKFKFGYTEMLIDKKCNMASLSTGVTSATMCGYDNRHWDYTRDYLCHVTETVV